MGATPWQNEMEETNSVSLHVRRGDCLSAADPCHYPCGLDYYESAVKYVYAVVAEPHFVLLSDDIERGENLHLSHACTAASSSTTRDYEEMELMSLCKHHIIANSTFSL
jgi:hypothetical protein